VAPGSGACRKARGGACAGYVKETARSGQTAETCTVGTETGKCAPDHCNVQIGDSVYCSQCSNGGSETSSPAPTNGVCSADNNECSVKADGRCTTCDHESFMFQGGCYAAANAPGSTMCEVANAGVCTQAKQGYFLPPTDDRDNTHQSVIPCGSEEEITVKNNHKYKGVAHCTQCGTPNPASDTTAVAATCTACEDGYFVAQGGAACTACQDENCATCAAEGTGKCSKCKTTGTKTYLKGSAGAGTCVEVSGCGSGFFPKADDKAGNKCTACGTASDGGIADCGECTLLTPASRSSTPLVTCTKCSTKKLSPLGDACLDGCPAGTYNDNNICKPCHTSCTECNSNANQDSCTACYPGSVLSKGETGNTGTCIPECTGRYAENCEAGMCTAVLGGSKYCSRCAAGYAPIDGMCTKVGTTRRDASGCTASGGKCTACTGANYALLSGGCYDTQALPGSAVCTAVTGGNGQCSACANGQTYASGNCPACAEGCAKCATDTNQCDTCYSGHYKSGTKCVKCSENSNSITGVPNCVSCAPPSGSGTVTCYVTQEPSVNPTDPSVNKTGLSSGAIAGISIAVIVVVGGLVGFLCWWFVCRGKA
ncbi:Variant-specific surface protein, partial [Giardia duodenalis]